MGTPLASGWGLGEVGVSDESNFLGQFTLQTTMPVLQQGGSRTGVGIAAGFQRGDGSSTSSLFWSAGRAIELWCAFASGGHCLLAHVDHSAARDTKVSCDLRDGIPLEQAFTDLLPVFLRSLGRST
jgi:hypothetical protein